jgi:hypothetical protein
MHVRLRTIPDACLARVNLLSSADQADHDCPGFVPVEIGDQECRFRSTEVRDLLPPAHEVGSLRLRPGPLRFIKDDDMIVWCARCPDAFISEVVNVLNEGFYALPDRPFSFSVADTRQLVARKGLLEDRHEWPVSREIHGSCFPERLPACRHVQADECFPSTGYAGYEHYGLLAITARGLNDFLNGNRRQLQVPRAGVVAGDSLN